MGYKLWVIEQKTSMLLHFCTFALLTLRFFRKPPELCRGEKKSNKVQSYQKVQSGG